MALSSALAQEGVSRVSSYISTKVDDKASRAHNVARLEMALSRLEFALERTGTLPITYVSLIRRWKMLKSAYIEGTDLLNKHKLGLLVTGSSYLQRIASAANLSISSLVGLKKEHLISSGAQTFEWYADCADKFVTDVESGCLLRRDIFPYPFVRQLFEGKTLRYQRTKGSQWPYLYIWPVILEGRGVEAHLVYDHFDPENLDKSFRVLLILRISESTDIVGTAINCLRSSASLINRETQDAVGELTLLHNLQDISYSYAPPWVSIQDWCKYTQIFRPDPVCCQANMNEPCVNNIIPSDLSDIFPEKTIVFLFTCYIPALDFSLPSASDKAGRTVMTNWPPLELTIIVAPHCHCSTEDREDYIFEEMGSKKGKRTYGSVQTTIGTIRSEAIDCLIRQPEVTKCTVCWYCKHGFAYFCVQKPSIDMASVLKTRGRYKTRSSAKRKR